ncbi:hypothetical protein RclHR1_02290023 [Rhizophagus clarus]|uniref:Uncharacterized protein LOC108669362 isoform X2 n=1 Tax=Rhizophagus clarus TaxID=94130 RepID=A0A2Z6QUY4_9GLOM|nr:hypothetical protein RclHR1_02290023 [Rhizophagus clarus]GES83050.1 uncharacterized protein LOC108669362 isoform X2 [Rhizophagus clarus]
MNNREIMVENEKFTGTPDELIKEIGKSVDDKKSDKKQINEKVKKIFEEEEVVRSMKVENVENIIEIIKKMMTIKTLEKDNKIVEHIKNANNLMDENHKKDDLVKFLEYIENKPSNNVIVIANKDLKIIVREIRKIKKFKNDELLKCITRILSNEMLGIGDKLFKLGEKLKAKKAEEETKKNDEEETKKKDEEEAKKKAEKIKPEEETKKDKKESEKDAVSVAMFNCYKKASELGHNEAIWQVGRCYEGGKGADLDDKKAKEYYTLAEREKKYYYNNLKELYEKWKYHNYISNRNSIIASVICLFSIVIGVFLFVNKSEAEKDENIVSTAIYGSGSTLTLVGSLTSLKTLFKKFKDNKEDLMQIGDLIKQLEEKGKLDDKKLENISEYQFNLDELRKHEKLNPLYFLGKLNRHMEYMLICRTILVSLMSLVFVILTIISIFILIVYPGNGNKIFQDMDIILMAFSSFSLWCIISIRICMQIFIPGVIEQDNINIEKFSNKIKIDNICQTIGLKKGWVWYRWFGIYFWVDPSQISWSDMKTSSLKLFKIFVFWFFFPTFAFIGLVSTNKRLKRIQMRDSELEEINRILFGLPVIIII